MLRLHAQMADEQPTLEILATFHAEERKADEVQGLIEIGGEG